MIDKAYEKDENPRIAVEVLLGHGICHIIAESSVFIRFEEAEEIVQRIDGNVMTDLHIVPQDHHLAKNQDGKIRCGDNGIFKGVPMTDEQKKLMYIAEELYTYYPYDGKYILDGDRLII
jgi:S-adenosylmethionine synthetase